MTYASAVACSNEANKQNTSLKHSSTAVCHFLSFNVKCTSLIKKILLVSVLPSSVMQASLFPNLLSCQCPICGSLSCRLCLHLQSRLHHRLSSPLPQPQPSSPLPPPQSGLLHHHGDTRTPPPASSASRHQSDVASLSSQAFPAVSRSWF